LTGASCRDALVGAGARLRFCVVVEPTGRPGRASPPHAATLARGTHLHQPFLLEPRSRSRARRRRPRLYVLDRPAARMQASREAMLPCIYMRRTARVAFDP